MARFDSVGESSSSRQAMDDDIVYVAVGREIEESKPTLLWVLENFGGRVCILHVHQPPNTNTSSLHLGMIRQFERMHMDRILDGYSQICAKAEVPADKIHIEMDDVAEGIVELVFRHNIKKLVMGAAANKHFNRRMAHIQSEKALYVCDQVPPHCQVWFICYGRLIHKREINLDACNVEPQGTSPTSVVENVFCDLPLMSLERTEEENFGQLISKFEQAVLDADKSKQEAYAESVKHHEAAKTAIETIHKATAAYEKERRCRREIEEALAKKDEELEQVRKELDKERLTAMNQKLLLENKIESCERRMKEMSDQILSTREMAEIYKKERDDMEIERDNTIKIVEEIAMKPAEEASSSQINNVFSVFSVSEITEITREYDQSLKIREGEYGTIYKGSLHKTQVVVKTVRQTGLQDPSHFQQEVDLLSKLRHPNLVTFIGACPEILALVYEYLPNGSLEDQLNCRENPMPWQTRISIATDLCAILIFLHSSNPRVVHGNLKPGNILLDARFSCKLSDFGIFRAHSVRENSTNCTDSEGTFPYLDPRATGVLSPKSDIYSFGIILLQLLTGKYPLNIAIDVQDALNQDHLHAMLDHSAGDWPYLQAKQLALLALRCCHKETSRRPDLDLEMWGVLERMRDSCDALSSFRLAFEDHSQPPSSFTCPISQEVMKEPHMAADGFTYDLVNISRWLNDGHNTSPMTNLRLEHCDLVPNHALRSAIQEWQARQ